MNKGCQALALFISALISGGLAAKPSENSHAVIGSIQIWKRKCNLEMVCELPEVLTARSVFIGSVPPPLSENQVGHWFEERTIDNFVVSFRTIWKAKSSKHPSHLIYQTMLRRLDNGLNQHSVPLAHCSQFRKAIEEEKFPVGFCSGFELADEGMALIEWGITFYR